MVEQRLKFGNGQMMGGHYILNQTPINDKQKDFWITPSEHTWAKGLKFDEELQRISNLISQSKHGKQITYYSIIFVQLSNGCRISEACEAMFRWAESDKNKVRVRVRKRQDEYLRLIVIPEQVTKHSGIIKRFLSKSTFDSKFVDNVKHHTKYHLYNTHALRYAFITKMSKTAAPQLIAKMTGHASLKHILHYTERVKAEEQLEDSITESNSHLS